MINFVLKTTSSFWLHKFGIVWVCGNHFLFYFLGNAIANRYNINLEEAFLEKEEENKKKFGSNPNFYQYFLIPIPAEADACKANNLKLLTNQE